MSAKLNRRRFIYRSSVAAGALMMTACTAASHAISQIGKPNEVKAMQPVERGYFSHQPPSRWEEAMLCGNGTLGVLVMGQPLQETITFSHEKLFIPWHEKLPPIDQGSHLREIRKMLEEGWYQNAAELPVTLARKAQYGEKRWTDPFFPACDLDIRLDSAGQVRDYAHSLDYTTGLASVGWQDDQGVMARRVFVSRADGIAVIQFGGPDKAKTSCELELKYHPPETVADYWAGAEKFRDGLADPSVQVEEGWLYFRGNFRKKDSGYACLARVITKNGSQKALKKSLRIENADQALVLFKIFPLDSGSDPDIPAFKASLAALPSDFNTLLDRHIAIHSALYNRTRLVMGDSQAYKQPAEIAWTASRQGTPGPAYFQRLFDAGRYEILCSSGEWGPNLQGVWSGIYGVPWSSDYTLNGNVQTAILGLLDGNLPECMESYINYKEFLAPDSRENARRLFGARGIVVASRTSTHGLNNHFDSTWPMTFWTAGAGWAAHFFYDYWLHTGDDRFFVERALPYMKDVALFYEDFLIEDAQGYWQFSPSYSPENSPSNTNSQACVNATMDIAVARELFNNLIEGCKTLRLEQDNIARWEAIKEKMPPYMINQDGAAKEWCDPRLEDQYDHRHASHLYPLFYGVAKELAGDPKLLMAFEKAYKFRETERKKEANVMAFGSVQLAQSALHLGDAETVWRIFQELASGYYYRNFATSHDRGPSIFNADLSGGMPALILEALVQSKTVADAQGRISGYQIQLLPVLPAAWVDGQISGVLTRGGFIVDITWEKGELKTIDIRNPRGKKCTLVYRGKEIPLANFTQKHLEKTGNW